MSDLHSCGICGHCAHWFPKGGWGFGECRKDKPVSVVEEIGRSNSKRTCKTYPAKRPWRSCGGFKEREER